MKRERQQPAEPGRLRRVARRARRFVLWTVLLAAGALGALQVPSVRARLLDKLSARWSDAERGVRLGVVRGLLPFDATMDRLVLSDAEGPWLTLRDLRVKWSVSALLRGRLVFEDLGAASVVLHRKPVPRAAAGEKAAGPPRVPAVEFSRLEVGELVLEEPVATERIALHLGGSASWNPRAGLELHARAHRMDDLAGRASLEAAWSASSGVWTATGELLDDPAGPFASRFGALDGPLTVCARGEGPSSEFRLRLDAEAPGVATGAVELVVDARPPYAVSLEAALEKARGSSLSWEAVSIAGRVANLQARPEGDALVRLRVGDREWTARSEGRLDGEALSLTNILVEADGVRARGAVTWRFSEAAGDGALDVDIPCLDVPSACWGWTLGGQAEARVLLAAVEGRQHVSVSGRALHVILPGVEAQEVSLSAELDHVIRWPNGRVRLAARNARASRLSAEDIELELEGDRDGLSWKARLAGGRVGAPDGGRRLDARAELEGQWMWTGRSRGWRWLKGEGRLGDVAVRLAHPVTLWVGAEDWFVRDLRLLSKAGQLTADARADREAVDIRVEIEDVPLMLLAGLGLPALHGQAAGRLTVRGPPNRPTAELALQAVHVAPRDPLILHLAPAGIQLTSRADAVHWETELTVTGLSEQPMTGRLDVPLHWSMEPFAWKIQPDAPLRGELRGAADLGRFLPPDGLNEQALDGALEAEFRLGGVWARPEISGRAGLKNGRYEHYLLGTLLDDISIAAEATASRLVVTDARASDGERGRFTLTGGMDLDPAGHFPFRLDLKMEEAALVRQDSVSLTADGEVTLAGSMADSLLSGRVRVREAEYRIPDRLAPEIVDLQVVEVNAPTAAAVRPEPSGRSAPLRLDLDVQAPGRVFVRGRGLDSEWRASLQVGGDLSGPTYAGTLSVLRGRFLLLGRRFILGRGTIALDGRTPAEPILNLAAESSVPGIQTHLALTGPLDTPELALTSEPPLPEDEIIALLLFGRSADLITPMQALRLAYGLSILRGGHTAFDVLGRGQSLLRVDQLELKQDEDQPELSAIAVGKYLGDRVYVQGEKSLAGPGDRIMVEIDLSRSLRLQTESSPQIREGLRLNWIRDY